MHALGVQFMDTALVLAVPVQLWGPLSVMVPLVVRLPLNESNGGPNDSAQAFCVTCTVMPMKEGSQWAVMSQAPLRSGQLPLPLLLPSEELEPHALHNAHNQAAPNRVRIITR